jgi:hypothetical protein
MMSLSGEHFCATKDAIGRRASHVPMITSRHLLLFASTLPCRVSSPVKRLPDT